MNLKKKLNKLLLHKLHHKNNNINSFIKDDDIKYIKLNFYEYSDV